MKKILTALTLLTIGATAGNLSTGLNTNTVNSNLTNKNIQPITNKINISSSKHFVEETNLFFGPGWGTYYSSNYKLLNDWNHYASNWNDFITKYPAFTLGSKSFFRMSSLDVDKDISNFQESTSDIKELGDTNNIIYYMYFYAIKNKGIQAVAMESWIKIWHDDSNIYFNFVFKERSDAEATIGEFSLNIDSVTFNS